MKRIKDKFSKLAGKFSTQRIYQMRQAARGLCSLCPEKAVVSGFCLEHAVKKREYQRRKLGSKRRNNAITYRLQNGENAEWAKCTDRK